MRTRPSAELALLVTVLIWSGNFTAVKVGVTDIAPLAFSVVRFALGASRHGGRRPLARGLAALPAPRPAPPRRRGAHRHHHQPGRLRDRPPGHLGRQRGPADRHDPHLDGRHRRADPPGAGRPHAVGRPWRRPGGGDPHRGRRRGGGRRHQRGRRAGSPRHRPQLGRLLGPHPAPHAALLGAAAVGLRDGRGDPDPRALQPAQRRHAGLVGGAARRMGGPASMPPS